MQTGANPSGRATATTTTTTTTTTSSPFVSLHERENTSENDSTSLRFLSPLGQRPANVS